MKRFLTVVAALAVAITISAGEAQAFGKKGKCGGATVGGCSSGQVVASGCGAGYGTPTTYGTWTPITSTGTFYGGTYSGNYYPGATTVPYITPTPTYTGQTYPATPLIADPTGTSMTATTSNGQTITLYRTGTTTSGQPIYSTSPTPTATGTPTSGGGIPKK